MTVHLQVLKDNPELNRLHNILEEEIHCYETAASRMADKKDCLLSGNTEQLMNVDKELLNLSQKATQLEKTRLGVIQEMGYGEVTLEKLINKIDPLQARIFHQTRQRLLRAVTDVDRLNKNNRDLLDLSLKWVEESVELIANLLTPEGASYDASGAKTKKPGSKPNATRPTPSSPIQSTVIRDA